MYPYTLIGPSVTFNSLTNKKQMTKVSSANFQKKFKLYHIEISRITLKCLSIGTPKIINFPFVSNGKFMVITCPNIQAHHNEAVLCLNFGTPENNEFSIWNKWKIYCFRCPNS